MELENKIEEVQCDFRKNRITIDAISKITIIMQRFNRKDKTAAFSLILKKHLTKGKDKVSWHDLR